MAVHCSSWRVRTRSWQLRATNSFVADTRQHQRPNFLSPELSVYYLRHPSLSHQQHPDSRPAHAVHPPSPAPPPVPPVAPAPLSQLQASIPLTWQTVQLLLLLPHLLLPHLLQLPAGLSNEGHAGLGGHHRRHYCPRCFSSLLSASAEIRSSYMVAGASLALTAAISAM